MNIKRLFSILFSIIVLWTGCAKNPEAPEYKKEIMIFGYLWGNEALNQRHAISIRYSQPLDETYESSNAAVRNAEVTLTDSAAGIIWNLHDSEETPGLYFNDEIIIQPLSTYILEVRTEDKTVTASTTVPPGLTLSSDLRTDSVNVETQKNLGYRKPVYIDCACPKDMMIVVELFCEESWEDAEYIHPFFGQEKPLSSEEYDGGMNGEPRRIQAFAGYEALEAPDFEGRHTIYWYASMIVFYGTHTMQVTAVDANFTNYAFAENPLYSGGIKNGYGLFSSMCGDTYSLNIIKE